jgi:hypothetical protein
VSPHEWQKQPRSTSPRAEAYRVYFQSLIDKLRTEHRFTGAKVGQPQNWYSFSSGLRGIVLSNSFAQGGKVRAEVYIDLQDKEQNKKLFDRLQEQQSAIEGEFGGSLSWERLDDKRASRIAVYRDGSIDAPAAARDEIREWSIENLLKLKKLLLPKVRASMRKVSATPGT